MQLSERSLKALEGVHPDLVLVVHRAAEITDIDFIVTEGKRTLEKQKILVAKGASQTMRSRHVPEMNECGMACAIDVAALIDGEVRWDFPLYEKLADTMKEAAHIEGIHIESGIDWLKFKDGPHHQLPWKTYP